MASGGTPRSCALLVLNYNGLVHLEPCLSTAIVAAERAAVPASVVLVDNRSTDESIAFVRRHFPTVQIVVARANDYLFSLNEVVESRMEDIVLILNNDMRFDPGFIDPLVAHFDDPDLFAATANVLDWEGTRRTTGRRLCDVRRFWFYKRWEHDIAAPCLTLEGGGGCAAFHRERFVALGGFDPLYRPGYWEDIDLSYRAWARGWKTVYEPRSIIYHRIGATMVGDDRARRFDRMLRRNEALFTLKNVGGGGFLAGYLAMVPLRVARMALAKNWSGIAGLWDAVPRAPRALKARFARSVRDEWSPSRISAAIREGKVT